MAKELEDIMCELDAVANDDESIMTVVSSSW